MLFVYVRLLYGYRHYTVRQFQWYMLIYVHMLVWRAIAVVLPYTLCLFMWYNGAVCICASLIWYRHYTVRQFQWYMLIYVHMLVWRAIAVVLPYTLCLFMWYNGAVCICASLIWV